MDGAGTKRSASEEDDWGEHPWSEPLSSETSESKRQRSVPPPETLGPLSIDPITGGLLVRQLPPDFSNMPGIRRLILPQLPARLFIGQRVLDSQLDQVLAAVEKKVVFLFEGPSYRIPPEILDLPSVRQFGIVVSSQTAPSRSPHGIGLQDPSGTLAKECNIYGIPGACAVLVEDGEVQSTMLLQRPLEEIATSLQLWTI